VEEFFGEPLEKLRRQVESKLGFQILIARTEVGGYCSECQIARAHEMSEVTKKPAAKLHHVAR
jgi:Fur family ferric uptake transcriptional regulator